MRASNKEFHRGLAMMKSSTPDGNTWPRNEKELGKAVAAIEQMGFAMYLEMGMPKTEAQTLARMTHGGAAGRLLLETAQQVDRERHE
jgi:hypothetical protein